MNLSSSSRISTTLLINSFVDDLVNTYEIFVALTVLPSTSNEPLDFSMLFLSKDLTTAFLTVLTR